MSVATNFHCAGVHNLPQETEAELLMTEKKQTDPKTVCDALQYLCSLHT